MTTGSRRPDNNTGQTGFDEPYSPGDRKERHDMTAERGRKSGPWRGPVQAAGNIAPARAGSGVGARKTGLLVKPFLISLVNK